MAEESWHTEDATDGIRVGYSLTGAGAGFGARGCDVTWFTEKAKMDLIDTKAYGKMLLIDGELQSTERDEYIYHEMLVHPVAWTLGGPKRVKIYGGGEGATAREVLRWPSVERVVQVDWDAQLLEHFKKVWVQWAQGAYEDPRMELRVADAWVDCAEDQEKYDYIIIDLPDPENIDAFRTLLKGVERQLAVGGGLVMNAGPVLPWKGGFAEELTDVLEELFPQPFSRSMWNHGAWRVNVPSFAAAGEWCLLGVWSAEQLAWATPPDGLRRFSEREWKYSRHWADDWPVAFARFN